MQVVLVLESPATFLLTCGRAVLVAAKRWAVVSRRTIWRLSELQTYVLPFSAFYGLYERQGRLFWFGTDFFKQVSELAEENELRDLFERFGRVTRVFLARDRETQRAKGFAFISYADRGDAALACEKVDGCMSSIPRFVLFFLPVPQVLTRFAC
jgi:hypothetical protein